MAPRETPKVTPKKMVKSNAKTVKSTDSTLKMTMSAKKPVQKIQLQVSNVTLALRRRTNTVPKVSTAESKDNKLPLPANEPKSAKKPAWKRRPKPAHSGVPIPEKMKKMIEKQLREAKSNLLSQDA